MARTKIARVGQQTILSIHPPGDMPDLQALYLATMDHSLMATTPAWWVSYRTRP